MTFRYGLTLEAVLFYGIFAVGVVVVAGLLAKGFEWLIEAGRTKGDR